MHIFMILKKSIFNFVTGYNLFSQEIAKQIVIITYLVHN